MHVQQINRRFLGRCVWWARSRRACSYLNRLVTAFANYRAANLSRCSDGEASAVLRPLRLAGDSAATSGDYRNVGVRHRRRLCAERAAAGSAPAALRLPAERRRAATRSMGDGTARLGGLPTPPVLDGGSHRCTPAAQTTHSSARILSSIWRLRSGVSASTASRSSARL